MQNPVSLTSMLAYYVPSCKTGSKIEVGNGVQFFVSFLIAHVNTRALRGTQGNFRKTL